MFLWEQLVYSDVEKMNITKFVLSHHIVNIQIQSLKYFSKMTKNPLVYKCVQTGKCETN